MEEKEFYDEEFDEDIYESKNVDELLDDDEIDNSEDAFLKGYDQDLDETYNEEEYENTVLCPNCGEKLKQEITICPVCGQNLEEAIHF